MLDREGARRTGLVQAAVRGGVDWVQVRDREIEACELLALVDGVREEARAETHGVRVIVNRRADVALASGADGVHLGFDAMDPADARELLGCDALVGVSAHTPEEIPKESAASAASYAHLAPIHTPLSKPVAREPIGNRALAAAAARGLPVIAQGGIDVGSARAAIDSGAAGIAVTGAILQAEDPERAARALREAIDAPDA